jgi:hypothetical protein
MKTEHLVDDNLTYLMEYLYICIYFVPGIFYLLVFNFLECFIIEI